MIMPISDRDDFVTNSVHHSVTPSLHISAPPIGLDTVLTMNVEPVSSEYQDFPSAMCRHNIGLPKYINWEKAKYIS